ncbi:MAG: hydrogenase-4 component E [Desulfovibrio sp.]|nr:hydrogenase-4 component E [Desulfovibrio sp.]
MTFSLPFDPLYTVLSIVVMSDLALLGAERPRLCIRLIAMQGLLMGLMPLAAGKSGVNLYVLGVCAVFAVIKGMVLPWLLRRTLHRLPPQAAPAPYVGHAACVVLGVCGLTLSIWLGRRMGIAANPLFSEVFPAGMATIIAGILLMVTRREILSQMFGYLVMENGIFLLGSPMAEQSSLWLELTVLLDILGAAFVMGIAVHHMSRAFDAVDADHIASLRD